jgi:hypothetical protein
VLALPPMLRLGWLELTAGVVLGLATATVGACSLIGDISADQCELDTDCDDLLGALEGANAWSCEGHVCVERASVGCTSHGDCVGRFSDDSEFPGPAYCAASTQQCAPLLDDHNCKAVGFVEGEDRIVLGVLSPGAASSDPRAFGATNAVELAIDTINAAGLGELGEKRRVAAIVCDSEGSDVDETLRWLHDDLSTRIVLSEQSRAQTVATAEIPLLDDSLFLATRSNDDGLQSSLAERTHAWSGLGTWESLIPAFVIAIDRAEARAIELGEDPADLKIMVVAGPDLEDRWLALQQATSQNLLRVNKTVADLQQAETVAQQLDGQDASVVVAATDSRFFRRVVHAGHGTLAGQGKSLVWVLGPGQRYGDELLTGADVLLGNGLGDISPLVIGIEHFTDRDRFATFADSAFGASDAVVGYNLLYDAIIALGLAAHQTLNAGGDPNDPNALGQALAELANGEAADVITETEVQDALGRLSAGQPLQLVGTSGPLAWDGRSRVMGVSTYCLVTVNPENPTHEYRFGQEVLEGGMLSGTGCW